MLSLLKSWTGAVEINGIRYPSIQDVNKAVLGDCGEIHIKLLAKENRPSDGTETPVKSVSDIQQYRITVKSYMTKPASADFDFMLKWNNNRPMPFRTMIGTVVKETRGMVYMKLHADIYAQVIPTCMKCGRPLTNKISQYFGVGPECGGHNYVNPFDTEEELQNAVRQYRAQLQEITWEGWIIKSAITEKEEI